MVVSMDSCNFMVPNRTGRWAGHLVQVQNLPRNSMPDLEDIYCASASQMFGFPLLNMGLMVDSGKRVRLLSLH